MSIEALLGVAGPRYAARNRRWRAVSDFVGDNGANVRWRISAATVLIVLVAAGCSLMSDPVVRVDAGLSPRMTPDQVADLAMNRIHQMELATGRIARPPRIVSVTATTPAGVAALAPDSGHGPIAASGIEWVIRAEGTFTNNHTPPGGKPMVATSGFFVISDADGGVVDFGFP